MKKGDVQEMCWHLFTWRATVTVAAPDTLRLTLAGIAAAVTGDHGGTIAGADK